MRKIFALIFLAWGTCAYGAEPTDQVPEDVSLVRIIAVPDKFDGRFIRVHGVGRIEFEGNQLCISRNDDLYLVAKNCLWLILDPATLEKLRLTPKKIKDLNGKYVIVEGIFTDKILGHLHMNSGAIKNITRYELGSTR